MASVRLPAGGMLRGVVTGVLTVCLGAVAGAETATPTPETGTLVVDLASGDLTTLEHTARITWHLTGDNIVNESVGAAWYSSYLDHSAEPGGRIVIDLDAGAVTGSITETWTCGSDDCQGWTYRDAEFTATITDGIAAWDDGELGISGTVAIAYRARGGRPETPSQCGDSPCYVCAEGFCTFDRTGTGTARLEGWVDGDTVAFAFADRLEADPAQMDVSGLADSEYFMSRFSITLAGVTPVAATTVDPGGGPATSSTVATSSTSPSTTTEATVVAGGGSVPGEAAPDAESEDTAGSTEASTASQTADDDRAGIVEDLIALILTVAILSGIGAALLLIRGAFRRETPMQAAARRRRRHAADLPAAQAASDWFRSQATHLIVPGTTAAVPNPAWHAQQAADGKDVPWGMQAPLPDGIELLDTPEAHHGPWLRAVVWDGTSIVYDAERLHYGVLRTGAQIMVDESDLAPLASGAFQPQHQLARPIEAPTDWGVVRYSAGHQVQVMERTSAWAVVRVGPETTTVVPLDDIVPVTTGEGAPPPPPPLPPAGG